MPRRILVLDDSPTSRGVVRVFLMGLEYEILEAEGADVAWKLLQANDVDLIITDLNLEGEDGISFVKKVRAEGRASVKSVPVILVSGDKTDEVRLRGLAAGVSAFIPKPVTPPVLRENVTRLAPPKKQN
jgi:two-component system, chemotaxis family, chemotaxis protein CheY